MEIRNTVHPDDFKCYTTQRIKKEFLVQNLFVTNEIQLVYTHFDRMIVGGVCPNKPIGLEGKKELGSDFFLERREMGIIMMLNLSIGLVTPPVGSTLFVGCAIGKVSIERVSRKLWPFWLSMFVILMLVTYFPVFSMWIPKLAR